MHSAKEKLGNIASAAKEHVNIFGAKAGEKAEKAGARTEEEKDIAHERRKAKEAKAKMELHGERAEHAADKQGGHFASSAVAPHHGSHQPATGAAPLPATIAPTYPPGGHPLGNKHI